MESVIVMLACAFIGFIFGWHLSTQPHPDQIDRYVMRDQQHLERWRAYCKLVKRIGNKKEQ
jgi:hypothetical protein